MTSPLFMIAGALKIGNVSEAYFTRVCVERIIFSFTSPRFICNSSNITLWNNSGNDVLYIYTGNVIKEYKIFSCYISEAISDTYTFNFPTLESMRDYAVNMKAKSMYDTGVDVSTATQVITLSTCTNDGEQRFIVHGMYVGEASLE